MSSPRLSAIVPVRNRSGLHLENCLRSLRWQDVATADVEIVVSDFGSNPEEARATVAAAETVDARYVATPTDEIWNRSRALNVGIQAATAPLVFCTDADMLFEPNFLSSILALQAEGGDRRMLHCHCHDLPEDTAGQEWSADDYAQLKARGTLRPTGGTGACQAAPASFFLHARGYDEKFKYWGAEDVDMTSRAQAAGLELGWLSERTSMLHQWHPTTKRDRLWQYRWNKLRYLLTRRQVVKNRSGWGAQR